MIKILELFGGIGACSKALEKLGIDYEIADYVEIDKSAVKSFNAIHGTNFEPQDICKWDKDIEVDLIMHGSPCQDFSVAGLQRGGDKGSGTRSSLMYETIRIIEKLKPKYVIWENVKNLLSEKHIHNFNIYIYILEQLGYTSYHQVLNAKDYGIPQNRERVFVVSIREEKKRFRFPTPIKLETKVKDILETNVDDYYYKVCPSMLKALTTGKVKDITNNQYCQTLTTKQARWNNAGLVKVGDRYRYLTPLECFLLMGFEKEDFIKAQKVTSTTQLYKQAGNSIVVNILEGIIANLLLEPKEFIGQTTIYDFI